MKAMGYRRATLIAATLLFCQVPAIAWSAATQAILVRATANINRDGLDIGCDGWLFIPTTDIWVTSLGYFDADDDGLLHSHHVGIFLKSSGALLTPLTSVQPMDPLIARFRWHDIPPVKLTAGVEYLMSADALQPFDPVALGVSTNFTLRPAVGYQNYWFNANNYFSVPDVSDPHAFLSFGGNFMFQKEDPIPVEAKSWGSVKTLYQ